MKAVACPEIAGFFRFKAALLACGAALLSFSGIARAQETPAPSPVIVPLDVSMEDANWLGTSGVKNPAGSDEGGMELLAVPPDFSISAPAEAGSPMAKAVAVRAGIAVQSPGTGVRPANGAMQRGRKRHYKVNGPAIEFDIPVQINGSLAGEVPLRIDSERNVRVQMAGLLALLQDRVDPQVHAWLDSTYSVNSHISFDQLRSAGVDVRYDAANDTVVMATK